LLLATAAGNAYAQSRYSNELDHLEIHYPDADFGKLDTFEAHSLSKADKAYNAKNYKQAHALYQSFTLEFGKSKATPFALLRIGRCRHKLGKRHKAVAEYQEVLDYFPNRVNYAAAALYYQGLCFWQNGEEAKAMAKWAKMAKDAEYAKHQLAAPALNQLAAGLVKQDQADKAAGYYEKVAVNFRRTNYRAALHAMEQAIHYHVRTNPSEAGLLDFYRRVQTFHHWRARKVTDDPVKSRDYWSSVRSYIRRYGKFTNTEGPLRETYYRYWADQMEGKFPEWDDFRIDLADFRLAHEKDTAKWFLRMDKQFAAYQKPGDNGRAVKWIGRYARHKSKVKEYYAKLTFPKMANGQIVTLMQYMFDRVKDEDLGRNVFGRLRLKEMKDSERASLAKYLWTKDEDLVKRVCASMVDRDLGRMSLLRYFRHKEDAKQGVPLAEALSSSAQFAAEALWIKAELLQKSGQYKKAIAAYQACDNPPDNIWRIAECYASLKQLKPAVRELRQVESFFRQRYGSQAAYRIAHLYRRFKLKKQHVAELRAILQKYPKSRESSAAHVELENMGYAPGGGENAKD